jgi:acetyltransferase (GNAT) family protein
MANAIGRQGTWLLRDDSVSIGTLTLASEGDPDFWTPDELRESALYVGKMASAVPRSGESLGALMLSWAQDWAAQSGFDSLRWDVWRSNERLQNYYRSLGGQYVRTVEAAHRWSGALFQAPVRRIANLSDHVVTYSSSWTDHGDLDTLAGALDEPPSTNGRSKLMVQHQTSSLQEGGS